MADPLYSERRAQPRLESRGLAVTIRAKGRLARLRGMVLDFNRHGLAVFLDQPLTKHLQVFLTLQAASCGVRDLIGVVHNCTAFAEGYRCGIQFRTDSGLQLDPDKTRESLQQLEAELAAEPNPVTG
jgi:hypothetical protein